MSTVSCESIRDALLRGRVPEDDPELRGHLASCAQCAALLADQAAVGRALSAETGPPELEPARWANLEQLMQEESGFRAWLRGRPTPWRVSMALVGVAVVAALGAVRLRPDFHRLAPLELLAILTAFVVSAGVALPLAFPVLGRQAIGTLRQRMVLALALAVPVVTALVRGAAASGASAGSEDFLPPALACFVYGSLLAAPLILLLWLLDRGAAPRSRSLYAAAVVGLGANAALAIHCSSSDAAHLLAGHAAIGLAFAGAAWLIGKRARSRA